MPQNQIITIDLKFQNNPETIACFLIPHRNGCILIESGPTTTLPELGNVLKEYRLDFHDITDVLLTHIHLDHAGAVGWLAQQGARIHVHHAGLPHLLHPEKLITSASRVYGELMDLLWGEILPVPSDKMRTLKDGEVLQIENLSFHILETPGHSNHHVCFLFEDYCFCGDILGIRLPNCRHLQLPYPPPEFNLQLWYLSLEKIRHKIIKKLALTHFGLYDDVDRHINAAYKYLEETRRFIDDCLPGVSSIEECRREFNSWQMTRIVEDQLTEDIAHRYEMVNPSFISADGVYRYWYKLQQPPKNFG